MASFPLVMAVVLLGMAVHRVFFPGHWRRWFSESSDEWLDDESVERYRRFSVPVLLLAAGGFWVWFLATVA